MDRYYFCYNPRVWKFLRYDCNIPYITKAKHSKTDKEFCLFVQDEELTSSLNKYKELFGEEI